MELTLWISLLLIFYKVESFQINQSLSFSLPVNNSILPTSSFWNGTLSERLLQKDFQFEIYLNEVQGLLFYGIDNIYQTLWLHFEMTKLIISYYNFKQEQIDHYPFETRELCYLQEIVHKTLNIRVSSVENSLIINCNGKEQKIYYAPNPQSVTNETFAQFLVEMKHPVPTFDPNNNETKTYIWIGNTPATNTDGFQNTKLEAQSKMFFGCIQSFSNGKEPINLEIDGNRFGNMIEPICKRSCEKNSCYNGGKCIELWRKMPSCQCGLSRFIGLFCNDSYAVDFDGHQTINISIENKLQKFELAFKQINANEYYESTKLFSIQFIFKQSLYVYIDKRRYLQVKFITDKSTPVDLSFTNQIEYNVDYILIIDADINDLTFKLINPQYRNVIEQKTITQALQNLVTVNISVGDSHAKSMKWMRRFNGCISNLILVAGKRKFLWNSIPDFNKLPKCDKRSSPGLSGTGRDATNDKVASKNNSSPYSVVRVQQASAAPVIIGIIVILIVLIVAAFLIYRYRDKLFKKGQNQSTAKNLTQAKRSKPANQSVDMTSVQNTYMTSFKPAYVAGSINYNSEHGRSNASLPHSMTPPLVSEDETCLTPHMEHQVD